MEILNLIPIGKDFRITSSEISKIANIGGGAVRYQINKLRSEGQPIASDKRGYYIASTTDELNHTIAQLNSRIHKIIKAREGLKKAQRKMEENFSV